jgi:hypothetical protein
MQATNASSGSSPLWACAMMNHMYRPSPFDKLVEGMVQPEMILDTIDIMWRAVNQGVKVNVIINNRAGGNSPLLAQMIAEKFLKKAEPAPKPKSQLTLW